MTLLDGIYTIDELDLENQRVFVRVDAESVEADVPLQWLVERALPTLEHAMSRDARVVVAAHLSPEPVPSHRVRSLEAFGEMLSQLSGWEVFIPDDCLSDAAKRVILDLRGGQICLLENLMAHDGEANVDETFARALAAHANVYINDAFEASNARLASLTTLPRLLRARGAGITLKSQVEALQRLKQGQAPVFVLGGAADGPKLDRLESLVKWADSVCLGAELGLLFLAARGVATGAYQPPDKELARARSLVEQAEGKLLLPNDFCVHTPGSDPVFVSATKVAKDQQVLDIGPDTLQRIQKTLADAPAGALVGSLALERGLAADSTSELVRALSDGDITLIGRDAIEAAKKADSGLLKRPGNGSVSQACAFDWLEGKRFFGVEALTGASNE
jgi:phosphoglycerate kinase